MINIDLTTFDFDLINIKSLMMLIMEYNHTNLLTILQNDKTHGKLVNAICVDPLYQCYRASWHKQIELSDFDNYKYKCKNRINTNYLVSALVLNKNKNLILFADHFTKSGKTYSIRVKTLDCILNPKQDNISKDGIYYSPREFEKFVLTNKKSQSFVRMAELGVLYKVLFMIKTGKKFNTKTDKQDNKQNSKQEDEFLTTSDDDYSSDDSFNRDRYISKHKHQRSNSASEEMSDSD